MLMAPRFLPRLAATVGLFTRYGLRDFARQQGLIELSPEEAAAHDSTNGDGATERAAEFRKRLVELGPAYVKLGQVLSTRPDLIPAPYIDELQHLQDDVGPVPFAEIEQIIQEQLGGRISKLFETFDHEPLATASLGQAHAATLRDSRAVVVKVQRPDIRASLADDMEFFRELAKFLSAHFRAGARVDMVGIVQQLERTLADELDYKIEARNMALFRRSLAEFPRLLVPKVVEGYTAERVLTTERVRGVKLSEIPPITRLDNDLSLLADELGKAYLKQIAIDGHFHADPHPGNVFLVLRGEENPRTPSDIAANERRTEERETVTPIAKLEQVAQREAAPAAPIEEPRLALIDFGMTARLSPPMRDRIVRLLFDLAENRGDDAGETLIEIGEPIPDFDRTAFIRQIAQLIAQNHERAVGDMQAGRVLYEAITIAYERGLKLPSELTLLAKTLFSLDNITRSLDSAYNPTEAIRSYTGEIINDRARRELSPARLARAVAQTTELLNALPHRIDLITQHMAANDFAVKVDAPQMSTLLKGMQKIANRIFTGLVLTGLLISSGLLINQRPRLGTTGFVLAAGIALYMVVSILVSDRRRGN
jgi:predicted unusual protein kinase regulating ubiquinone biosynthesis (AarF/ABC1/UbiB family)